MTDQDSTVTVSDGSGAITPGQLWSPTEGEEAGLLVSRLRLRDQERRNLIDESVSILARCTNPADPGPSRRAGLVVGGVQSGKTLSFTTVMALARDNGYQLVVLVAGTKENLLEQSRDRLSEDLSLRDADTHYRWVHHQSPRPGGGDAERLAADLRHTLDVTARPDERPTVLITVMKNHRHMANASEVLHQVGGLLDLRAITALVIDDEADQATPNLRRTGESATYRNLREIRDALPRHTLLEYTATPQAPLLVSIADELSPEFTCVLTAGEDYTGGQFFFEDHRDTFLEIIPALDLACITNPTLGPPMSLLRALALFFVGATASQLDRSQGRVAQRSMLVHPSQATLPQASFRSWIEAAQRGWIQTLADGGTDRDELIDDFIRPAYDDLANSVENLAPWDDVLARLPSVMDRARIEEVNARGGRPPVIDWSSAYAWILIGGALMDRGFTVEGLTVTYMPRGTGVGNADTVQQRARFFGYKRSYAGYCRAWLESDVADVFSAYVTHEEAMRGELRKVAEAGEPLRQWRRRFLLDPNLRPTRQAAIRLPLTRWDLDDRWLQQWHVPLPPHADNLIARNQTVVDAFLAPLGFSVDSRVSGPTAIQTHDRAEVQLAEAYEQLLVELTMVEGDHNAFLGLLLSIDNYLNRAPDPGAVVYRMSQGASRERALDGDSTRIKSLFQGRSRDSSGSYAGDRLVRDEHQLTMQIHFVDVRSDSDPARLVCARVPFLAVWVPAALGLESALVQA